MLFYFFLQNIKSIIVWTIWEDMMSKIFIIPDVHLKPWMFDKAEEIIEKNSFDRIVLLGDLVDDWDQEKNLNLYKETLERTIAFVVKYPDTLYCFGNHDLSYLWQAHESGYSSYARETVVEGINNLIYTLPAENSGFIHRIDNVLFSHAGLTEHFVIRLFGYGESMEIDVMLEKINRLGKDDLWRDDSPIWARPQFGNMRMYPSDMLQVVGHTPVKKAYREGNIITLDNFSTYGDGTPIGDERFAFVDTIKMEHEYV